MGIAGHPHCVAFARLLVGEPAAVVELVLHGDRRLPLQRRDPFLFEAFDELAPCRAVRVVPRVPLQESS
jgi:hypothetical protein